MRVCEVFSKIVEYGTASGVKNICDFPGAWIQKVDEQWTFALNGKDETLRVDPGDGGMSATVDFGNAAVWYNGWLAGTFDPSGGIFVTGSGANEDSFIAAMDKAIASKQTARAEV